MRSVGSRPGATRIVSSGGLEQDRYVDIHCHCLSGFDDGPATMSEALGLCRELAGDGIAVTVATPHQLGRYGDGNGAGRIREAVVRLNEELQRHGIGLSVLAGADVRVDERICRLLEKDEILTLADGHKYILLELPHQVFIDIEPLLAELEGMGIRAIISHPERQGFVVKQPKVLAKWFEHSACLQVTCASVLGDFGAAAQAAAWRFLDWGWAGLVATDSHDLLGRRPRMKAAFEQISARMGESVARLVCVENPRGVIEGKDIARVRTVRAKGGKDDKVPVNS